MTLALTLQDLAVPGVRVWWYKARGARARVKRKYQAIEWSDVVILRPKLTWPGTVRPEREEGWGDDSFRITYVSGMGRVYFQRNVETPDLDPFLDMDATSFPKRVVKAWRRKKVDRKVTYLTEGEEGSEEGVYVGADATERICAAVDRQRQELELYLVPVASGSLFLVEAAGLRAITPAVFPFKL